MKNVPAGTVHSGLPLTIELFRGRFPHVVIALFIFMGLSCAKQGYPPGGSVDKEPPYLVSSVPPAMMTEVSTTEPIVFEFSESMNQENIFLPS